jgi:acyl-CoA thioester hydrolase
MDCAAIVADQTGNHREAVTLIRVRYSETDQMGTFYNSRALEWFECGRTAFSHAIGIPYAEMERRGVLLPVVEAHIAYLGRARYDDSLQICTSAGMEGRARVRFENRITNVETGVRIASGYTIHAVVDPTGRPIRPPEWFIEAIARGPGGLSA